MVDVDVVAERITELGLLKRGDHIAVVGTFAGVQYYHHGIFLGHTNGVAEFGGDNKANARPRIVNISEFTNKGERELIRYVYKQTECLPPEDVAMKAEDLVAHPEKWKAYDLLQHNCEHFATWCKIGRAVSNQVWEKLRNLDPLGIFSTYGSSIS